MSDEKILLVDDESNILEGFRRELRKRYNLDTATSGEEALKAIQERGPFAVVVSDFNMDGMNGIELLTRVREVSPDSVRIMLTGGGSDSAVAAVNEGHIFRFLTKPCPGDMLAQTLADALSKYQLIIAERNLLSKTLTAAIHVMTNLLAQVKPCAFGRAARIRLTARQICDQIAPERSWKAEIAALLSQIGCAALSDETLKKAYANKPLKPSEQQAFDNHPVVGKALIANVPRLEEVAEIIGHQASRFDGGDSTDPVAGEAIPIEARILKLALDFDSVRSTTKSLPEALAELQKRKSWYDPVVLSALKRVVAAEAARQIMDVESAPEAALASTH